MLASQFCLFDTFLLDNENAGGSAICIHGDLLLEEVLVTHSITCHGRDYIVNIQFERHSLVVVNVHFEPDFKAVMWQIGSYSPTLTGISTWRGCYYFGRLQHL